MSMAATRTGYDVLTPAVCVHSPSTARCARRSVTLCLLGSFHGPKQRILWLSGRRHGTWTHYAHASLRRRMRPRRGHHRGRPSGSSAGRARRRLDSTPLELGCGLAPLELARLCFDRRHLRLRLVSPIRSLEADKQSLVGAHLFDKGARDATDGGSASTRNTAAKLGDVGFYSLQALPFADSLVTPLLTDHWNEDIAWELTVMNLQATSAVFALARTGASIRGRARPDVHDCNDDGTFSDSCLGGPYSSFPSGHTAAAFAGAGLMCAHHSRLALWGDPVADASACVVPVGVAAATGATRLIAARHWATDVVAGAALGFGLGYGMPTLLHYAPLGGRNRTLALRWGVHPMP